MLAQAQKGAGELQNETVKLLSAAFKLQNKVVALQSEIAELEDTNLKQQFAIQLSKAVIKKVSASILFNKEDKAKHLAYLICL